MTELTLVGISGFRNRGVEAIVGPTIKQMRRHFANARFTVITRTPTYDRVRMGMSSDVEFVGEVHSSPTETARRRLRSSLARLLKGRAAAVQATDADSAIHGADLVIAVGGDVFSSTYGDLARYLHPLEIAIRSEVPIAFIAHSIGPFDTDAEAQAWIRVAERAQVVSVRETLSFQYLTEELGLSADKVFLTADPAFLLQASGPVMIDRILKFYGVRKGLPNIALSISNGISHYTGIDENQHFESWRQIIQMLLDANRYQVVLIPHVQESRTNNDDRVIASRLVAEFQFDDRIRLIAGDHSAAELKGVISACNLVIAERMHAAIAGISSAVPTIAVQYSVKSRGILSDILGAEMAGQYCLIAAEDLVERPQIAYELIEKVWADRENLQARLELALPATVGRALLNFELLAQYSQDAGVLNSISAQAVPDTA